ncbi:unnamed protein product, partial [marine sediment metagenome]
FRKLNCLMITLKNNKIGVVSIDPKMKESLEECLEIWKNNFNLHGEKLFRKLPIITSHHSRMFFSGIEKG